TATRLQAWIGELSALHPPAAALSDPLQLILWENVGYLIDDERRAALFAELAERVGLSAAAIDRADGAVLLDIASRGGMRPDERVDRWRRIARLVLDQGGDLGAALAALPPAKARTLLKCFPMIGGPGADKVMLFAGLSLEPSLESNGLRVLARLGLIADQPNYGALYKDGVALLKREGIADREWLVGAFEILRQHGKALCRRSAPQCLACPLDAVCAHAPVAV
ncbi:MAG TPA: hypothetical protein VGC92_11015, partial [Phenylobacterium sp.]